MTIRPMFSLSMVEYATYIANLGTSLLRERMSRCINILISAATILAAITIAVATRDISFTLRPANIAVGLILLLGNALCAGFRLRSVARRFGYRLKLNDALRANAVGAGLAQIMISYLGHTTGRIAVLRNSGIAASDLVEIGLVERLAALATLASISIVAAVALFGSIALPDVALQQQALYAATALVLSLMVTVVMVYRPLIVRFLTSGDATRMAAGLVVATGWSILTHLFMLAAFAVMLASVVTLNAAVIGACALIMFAAAIPISFGGWGVRELSAVAALVQVGVDAGTAVQASVAIGLGSLLSQIAMWFLTVPVRRGSCAPATVGTRSQRPPGGLLVAIPALISILIGFAVHLPTDAGILNVNLADPLAIVALAAFGTHWLGKREFPQWSMPGFNLSILAITILFIYAAVNGYFDFGYSAWGIRNRLLGWLVLLGYVSAGAMIVHALDDVGRRIVLAGFVLTMAVISGLEIVRFAAIIHGWAPLAISGHVGEGFSKNVNAQAALLIVALAATLIMRRERLSAILLTLLLTGLFLTQSRSGLGAAAGVLAIACIMRPRRLSRIVPALLVAVLIINIPPLLAGSDRGEIRLTQLVQPLRHESTYSESDSERMKTISEGLALWRDHPVAGAGLGAYYEQTTAEGAPLVIHSTPVWLLAETGTIGFLLFAGIAISLAGRFGNPAWRGDDLALAGFLVIAGLGAMALVQDLMFQRIIWFAVGILLATNSATAIRPVACALANPNAS